MNCEVELENLETFMTAEESFPEDIHSSVSDSLPISSSSSTSSAEFTNIIAPSDVSSQSPFFSHNNSSVNSLNSAYQEAKDRVDVETVESETTPSAPTQHTANSSSNPMTINLDGVPNPLDRTCLPNGNEHHVTCPHCGHGFTFNTSNSTTVELITGEPLSSPVVVPPSPLAAAAYESGMSIVEEPKLLKQQVQDVSRACNAVARGDVSQKITGPSSRCGHGPTQGSYQHYGELSIDIVSLKYDRGSVPQVDRTESNSLKRSLGLAGGRYRRVWSIAKVTKAVTVSDLSDKKENWAVRRMYRTSKGYG
ncbi:hypothetical protein QCA50_004633 [Cerrena zonata]|uniref:Uncharacterized protein n=1 Tax=Cerrena zonata TaxID=2478898 RepID=A0AAW0GI25_9APHY